MLTKWSTSWEITPKLSLHDGALSTLPEYPILHLRTLLLGKACLQLHDAALEYDDVSLLVGLKLKSGGHDATTMLDSSWFKRSHSARAAFSESNRP
jgi:hypothetical protein